METNTQANDRKNSVLRIAVTSDGEGKGCNKKGTHKELRMINFFFLNRVGGFRVFVVK